jgi:hypothetical protein
MKKKTIINGMALIGVLFIFIAFISAIPVCCEKTKAGAWCQYEDEKNCDPGYNSVPTSCEATSYCQVGTCINSKEGNCLPSPQTVCEDNGGYWDVRQKQEIPQCQLGCCFLGESVAFVTQTRCERFSSVYGLITDFRADIDTELECLASASPSAKGACTYGGEFETRCKLTTKKECRDMEANPSFSDVQFHEGYLCSAEILETICGPRGGTICGEDGKVYFLDTCGNLGNVYDSSKLNDGNYWTYIQTPSESCSVEAAKDSSSCGNCDYYAGSVCKPVKAGESVNYGEYICRDLDCTEYKNKEEGFSGSNYPIHGESWCADSSGTGTISAVRDDEGNIVGTSGGDNSKTENLPGSSFYKKYCWEGEVIVEACQDYRQEICMQSEINGVGHAECKINNWRDCYDQTTKKDCEDRQQRDCKWMATGYSFSDNGLKKSGIFGSSTKGICVPLYAPGFDRSSSNYGDNGLAVCSLASATCVVTYTAKVGDLKELKEITGEDVSMEDKYEFCEEDPGDGENCECLLQSWQNKMNSMCTALGDCGNKNNLIDRPGKKVNPIDIEPLD